MMKWLVKFECSLVDSEPVRRVNYCNVNCTKLLVVDYIQAAVLLVLDTDIAAVLFVEVMMLFELVTMFVAVLGVAFVAAAVLWAVTVAGAVMFDVVMCEVQAEG
jgi:hypothetical protein